MTRYDRDDLIQRIKYLSKYNTPCPEWVYGVIKYYPADDSDEIMAPPIEE